MKQYTKETLTIFWKFTLGEWKLATLAMTMVFVTAILQAYLPFLYKQLVDIMTEFPPEQAARLGGRTLVYIGLLGVIIVFLRRVQDWAALWFQPRVKQRLLEYCYEYLQGHSLNFFSNNFAGSLVRKVNRFDRAYEDLSDQVIFMLGQTWVRVIIIIAAAAIRSWAFAGVILAWVVIFSVVSYLYAKRRMKHDLATAEQDSTVTGFLADTIGNIMNIKLFSSQQTERKEFSRLVAEQQRRLRKSWTVGLEADLVQGLLLVVLEVATIAVVFWQWRRGQVTVGDFALMQAYAGNILGRLWDFGRNVRRIFQSLADANEMTELLLTAHEVKDTPGAKKLHPGAGFISYSDVGFAYQGQNAVFSHFNLTIPAGQRVALVGPSGGGKSTLVKLLFRFFDVHSGSILIDNQDIASVTQESLRKAIALVPQEPVLFHRSLLENIRYARPSATKEEVIRAAKLAHCHEFISAFPEGYATFVGERGVKLSGGERQRVAIARALLKNAPILVLDEATSSLDSESESLIQDALKNLMNKKTVIVIAHRLSTIMQMDRIVVLENGRITEDGRHEELVKARQGTYQKLWEIQAGSFA